MKKFVILSLLVTFTIAVKSQRDCGYYYEYKGSIKFDRQDISSKITILVPVAFYLNKGNRKKENKKRKLYFNEILINNDKKEYSKRFFTLGPCDCNHAAFLSNVFISSGDNYRIIIKHENIEKEILIDISEIAFYIKGNIIEIELPEIEI